MVAVGGAQGLGGRVERDLGAERAFRAAPLDEVANCAGGEGADRGVVTRVCLRQESRAEHLALDLNQLGAAIQRQTGPPPCPFDERRTAAPVTGGIYAKR